MERGDAGYLRVVAGMPDPKDRLPSGAGRRLKGEERRALVERLRRQGWSYRRISDELNISYATVARWLDGPEAASPPLGPLPIRSVSLHNGAARLTVASVHAPPALPEPDSALPLIEHLISQNRALLQRVDQLASVSAAQKQAIADLEVRLVSNIEDQHKKLGERLLDSIKLLLRKFSPQ